MSNQSLRHRIDTRIAELMPCLDAMPGVVTILNMHEASVVYMNQTGLDGLGTTLEKLVALGSEYHPRYFNPEDSEDYVPRLMGLVARNDPGETVTLFQQVRTGPVCPGGLRAYQWYCSGVRIFLHDDDGQPLLVIATSLPIDAEHYYTPRIERLLAENELLRARSEQLTSLTRRERELLALMARDVSAPDMARQLFISQETVKTHRRNIRRKLGVQSHYELVRIAQALNLV